MNSEMQRRLYEMEVTPPQAVWEKLSLNIDEINEDNRIAKRLFTIELAPPATAWEKLTLNLNEINEDNRVANKILNAEVTPPAGAWEKINSSINVVEELPVQKKGTVIKFRKLTVAATLIAVILTGWILFRNNNNSVVAEENNRSTPDQTAINPNTNSKKVEKQTSINPQNDLQTQDEPIASVSTKPQTVKTQVYTSSRNKNQILVQPEVAQYAVLNTPSNKRFDRSIDDLSLVTSDQNYYTMVNANGRLVKIPAQLASLAPHLQDKPISEDYNEVMFGEGNYWKETLDEWRKKIAAAPITTGDAFTSFVELLKTVQSK